MVALAWTALPAEMKYSVVDLLNSKDTAAFAKASSEAYALSIPAMFRDIRLTTFEALKSFVANVPIGHCRYVRRLHIEVPTPSTAQLTAILGELLTRCTRIEELSLRITGSLKPTIIPCFGRLEALTELSIANIGQEETHPLSERLVVSIAAAVPHLTHLTVDRITRSSLHASELLGSYPCVPVVVGDDDVPVHPFLGFNLSLPSLLQIPTLRVLRVLDTHLGDQAWGTVIPRCALDMLELGSSCYESPEFNSLCAERILANVGRSLSELSLGSPLPHTSSSTTLRRLRKLRVTPVFPLESLVETLSTLSASPIEELSVVCHEDDAEDMCDALEDFLSQCVDRRAEPFYGRLADVGLHTVSDLNDYAYATYAPGPDARAAKAHSLVGGGAAKGTGIQRVQEFLRDIRSAQKSANAQALPPHYHQHPPCAPLRR